MDNSRFQIGQIIELKSLDNAFIMGGASQLLSALHKARDTFKSSYDYKKIHAKVVSYGRFDNEYKCFVIRIEWLNPYENNVTRLDGIKAFNMVESEFVEFGASDFSSGTWVYYMGAEAGGSDTTYWKKGMVGKIQYSEGFNYVFDNGEGDMKRGGSNSKCAFRLATNAEIWKATGPKKPLPGEPLPGIVDFDYKPSYIRSANDDVEISFKQTKLKANKLDNSKEISDFLLIS